MTYRPSKHAHAAIDAAAAAGEIIRCYYRGDFETRSKADRTPVTVADVESEEAIRLLLTGRFPEHGFYGEETGRKNAASEYLWLVDPIDGTKGFVRQYPFFSTQIGLMRKEELVLGVSSAPLFEETAIAERGSGAWLNGSRLAVSEIDRLDNAAISTGNLKSLAADDAWSTLGDIVSEVDRIRGYGDFYHYHLLAAGKIEAVIESDVNILDIAALTVVVREAGGVMTGLDGSAIGLDTRSVLAGNPVIHALLLERFASSGFDASVGAFVRS